MYSARNLSNAFDSFYEFMIDPITKEVLKFTNLPNSRMWDKFDLTKIN